MGSLNGRPFMKVGIDHPMFEQRDLHRAPYSNEELRVVDYLHMVAPDIGAGDDPIGFLLASHNWLMRERRGQREAKRDGPHTIP
jgi:hypothetical protein